MQSAVPFYWSGTVLAGTENPSDALVKNKLLIFLPYKITNIITMVVSIRTMDDSSKIEKEISDNFWTDIEEVCSTFLKIRQSDMYKNSVTEESFESKAGQHNQKRFLPRINFEDGKRPLRQQKYEACTNLGVFDDRIHNTVGKTSMSSYASKRDRRFPRLYSGHHKSLATVLKELRPSTKVIGSKTAFREENADEPWSEEEELIFWREIESLRHKDEVSTDKRNKKYSCKTFGTSVHFDSGSVMTENNARLQAINFNNREDRIRLYSPHAA